MKRGDKVVVKSTYQNIPAGTEGTLVDSPDNAIFKATPCPLVRVSFPQEHPRMNVPPLCIWYRLDEIEPAPEMEMA